METLRITTSILERMKEYKCSEILIDMVIEDFKQLGNEVIIEDDSENPFVSYELFYNPEHDNKNCWEVTGYLQTDSSVAFIYKCLVISFFIRCDGIVNYDSEYCLCRDVGTLSRNLWVDGLINGDEHDLLLSGMEEVRRFNKIERFYYAKFRSL